MTPGALKDMNEDQERVNRLEAFAALRNRILIFVFSFFLCVSALVPYSRRA